MGQFDQPFSGFQTHEKARIMHDYLIHENISRDVAHLSIFLLALMRARYSVEIKFFQNTESQV